MGEIKCESRISPSTITYLCYLNGTINIANIAKTIPVVKIEDEEGKEIYFMCEGVKTNGDISKHRITLPFYGNSSDDIFVICSRYTGICRGIRRGGGYFHNVTAIDFQCCEKNIHVKISKTKLTFTGILSDEMGKKTSQYLCQFLDMTNTNIKFLQQEKEETFKIMELIKNEIWDEKENTFRETRLEFESEIQEKIFRILSIYFTDNDILKWEDYDKKIKDFLEMSEICTPNIKPLSYQICTAALMYDLPIDKNKKTNFCKLSLFLSGKNLDITYTNKKPNELLIRYPSNSNPGCLHSISIRKGKKMRHNSPANEEETYQVYTLINNYLKEFFEENKDFSHYLSQLSSR